jgi:putative transposase
MREWQNQSPGRWYCRYHIIIVPKYRQKAIFGTLRQDIGKILRERCEHMGIELVEGHAMPDHGHLCLSIPPKYRVANAVGRLKGKAAIRMHREYLGRTRNCTGLHFWARGYCVRTVGCEEAVIRQYIRKQEEPEKRAEQLALGDFAPQREGKYTHRAGPGNPSAPLWGPPATAPSERASCHSAPCGGRLSRRPLKRASYNSALRAGILSQCLPSGGHPQTTRSAGGS